jgi:hypothetical protein
MHEIDRAIFELKILNQNLAGLEHFASTLDSTEWFGYRGGVEDCRMHILIAIEKLEGEKNGVQSHE